MGDSHTRILNFTSNGFLVTSVYLNIPPTERVGRPTPYMIRFKNIVNQKRYWLDGKALPTEVRKSVEQDFVQIEHRLGMPENLFGENSLPVRGVACFACSAQNFFEMVKLPFVYRDTLVVDQEPYARMLLAVEAELGINLVVTLDHQHARFYQVDISGIRELQDLITWKTHDREKPGVSQVSPPRGVSTRHGVGGYNVEMLKQEELREHLRHVGQTLFELRKTHPFDRLLAVAADDLLSLLPNYLHDYLRRAYVGSLQVRSNEHTPALKLPPNVLYEATLAHLLETDQEQVSTLVASLTSQPNMAVVGVEKTLEMLTWGNVRTLLVDPEFSIEGYVFYPSRLLGLKPEEAPEGTESVWHLPDLVDAILERAIEQGAAVKVVHSQEGRAAIQGLGALLRYPLPNRS